MLSFVSDTQLYPHSFSMMCQHISISIYISIYCMDREMLYACYCWVKRRSYKLQWYFESFYTWACTIVLSGCHVWCLLSLIITHHTLRHISPFPVIHLSAWTHSRALTLTHHYKPLLSVRWRAIFRPLTVSSEPRVNGEKKPPKPTQLHIHVHPYQSTPCVFFF